MPSVARVEFAGPTRHQYCTAAAAGFRPGDVVIVETEWGVGMGEVRTLMEACPTEAAGAPLRPILRKATPTDLARRMALQQREWDARTFCRERIRARNLPMKLADVRIGLDSTKAMFFFTADGRVDFRELVKDLVAHLRMRVELRQIGVRDEARVLGCAGPCGRAVCCHTFMQTFASVSIRMAKDQSLALNPGKLSGICGRLKCCLAFEHSLYAELRRGFPKVGAHVQTARGTGTVRAQNLLEQSVLVELESGGQVALRAAEVEVRPRPEPPPRPREAAPRVSGEAAAPGPPPRPRRKRRRSGGGGGAPADAGRAPGPPPPADRTPPEGS